MQKNIINLLTLSILLLSTFDCMAQSDGYFDRIATVSDGRITRFSEMPIVIYAKKLDPYNENCTGALNYALREWEEGSAGIVKFSLTQKPEDASILISWVKNIKSYSHEHPLGLAELHRTDVVPPTNGRTEGNEFYVELQICLHDPMTAKPLSIEQLKPALLHEIGHAIGLWGHSKDRNDVMYYAANVQHPTLNDIMTLKSVYSYENGYPFHEKSIAIINEDINADPSDAMSHFLLGTIYMDQKNYELSIESLKKCLELNPQYHKARVALASAYKNIGQEKLAITEYFALAQSEPTAMIYNIIAVSFFNNGDFDQAIQHFRKSLEIDRTYEPAKRNLYGLYLSRGNELIRQMRYKEAINIILEGIKAFPEKPELINLLGIAYSEMGLYEEALNQYKTALNYNPGLTEIKDNIASCYNNLGIKYAKSNQWEKAIETYNQALVYSPEVESIKHNLLALYWNRAIYYSSIGDTNSAVNAYLDYIERQPDSSDAYNNLGAAYSRLGEYDKSVEALERALNCDPNSQDVKNNLAIAYHKWGFEYFQDKYYHVALEKFKRSLEILPDNVDVLLIIGVTHDQMGNKDEALKYFENVLRIDPQNANAKKLITNLRVQLGDKYIDSKDYGRALEYYTTIPEDMMTYRVRNNIAYIYIMGGEYMLAIDQIDRVLMDKPYNKTANQNLLSIESKLKGLLIKYPYSSEFRDQLARVRLSITMSYIYQEDIERAKRSLVSAINLKPKDYRVREMLKNGCQKLAGIYAEKGYKSQTEDIRDLANKLE